MAQRWSYQLFTSRHQPNLRQTISMLARAGYHSVEGYGGVYSDAGNVRALLDDYGMTMPSGHFSFTELEDQRAKALKIAHQLGMNLLAIPYLDEAERPRDAGGWRTLAKRLTDIARVCRAEGFAFAWHNHDFEFRPLQDGSLPIDQILGTAPLVDWEIDVAWVMRVGVDPVPFIERYAATITACHIKDKAREGENESQNGWSDVGAGVMDWASLLRSLHETKARIWVVEHDNPTDDALFAQNSINYLNSIN